MKKSTLLSMGLSVFLVPVGFSQVMFNFDYAAAPDFNATSTASLNAAAAVVSSYFQNYNTTINLAVTSENNPASTTLASAGSNFAGGAAGFGNRGIVGTKILGGADANGGAADGTVTVNFGINWAFGDTVMGGTPPPPAGNTGQYDFKSTMIHELFHAVGFSSSITQNGEDPFGTTPGTANGQWAPFDQFVADSTGRIIDQTTFALDGARWNTASVGGTNTTGLFFNGPNANAANGGNPVNLFSPNPWEDGSSGSHVDDQFGPTSTLIMAAATNTGLSARMLSDVEVGIMRDIGFTQIVAVPEPATVALWMGAVCMIAIGIHRRRQRAGERQAA